MPRAAHHASRPGPARVIAAITLAAIACAQGCSVAPKPAGSSRATGSGIGVTAFEPVEVRIHPLTRMREDPDTLGRTVDLYFELIDRWGHGVKGLGVMTVELRSVSAGGQRDPFQLRTWTVSLADPAASSAAYDRVTRTYHLTLADVPSGQDATDLRVRFRTGRGRDMTDGYSLRGSAGQ